MTDEIVIRGLDSKEKLKKFLDAKHIRFIVFDAATLVDALSLEQLVAFQQFVVQYEDACRAKSADPNGIDWAVRALTPSGGVVPRRAALEADTVLVDAIDNAMDRAGVPVARRTDLLGGLLEKPGTALSEIEGAIADAAKR